MLLFTCSPKDTIHLMRKVNGNKQMKRRKKIESIQKKTKQRTKDESGSRRTEKYTDKINFVDNISTLRTRSWEQKLNSVSIITIIASEWFWIYGWIQIKRLNPMEFPLFSHYFFSLLVPHFFAFSFVCVCVCMTENKFWELNSILMHLFRWTMEDVDFAKIKEEKTTNRRTEMREGERKKLVTSKESVHSFVQWFHSVFPCVFFSVLCFDDFSILNLFVCFRCIRFHSAQPVKPNQATFSRRSI